MYSGDPLEDFTTHAFLNRFVFRNPNQKHIASSKSKFMSTFSRQPANIHSLVGEFMQAPSTKEVKVDEDFFQKFFEEEKYRKPKKTQIAEDDLEDVDEELEKDEFMDEILERDLLNNEKSLGLPQSDDVEDDNGSYQSDEDDDKDSFGSSDNEEKLEDELDEDELVFNENGMSETLNDDEEDDDEILEFGAEEPVDYEIEKPVKKGSSKSSPFADLDELSQLFEGGLETADEKRLKGIDKWLKLQNKSGKKRKGTQAPAPQKSKKKSKSHKKK